MNTTDIWLIAGLGNPETKYDGTRHNAGYAALDYLADKWNISVGKTKFQGLWGQGEVDGHKVVLLKPLTYMNLSGDSIAPTAGFFKIPADHVIVLCDDITQNPGKLRIRPSGSAGGHNGLKSIIARLGGENFPRIRIGVGAKPHPDYDLAAWVLGKFPAEDAKALSGRYPDLEAAAKLIMDGKLSLAQSKYNGRLHRRKGGRRLPEHRTKLPFSAPERFFFLRRRGWPALCGWRAWAYVRCGTLRIMRYGAPARSIGTGRWKALRRGRLTPRPAGRCVCAAHRGYMPMPSCRALWPWACCVRWCWSRRPCVKACFWNGYFAMN